MNVLVIIPAYCEEDSIVQTVEELKETLPNIDYVIINDGSTDNTEKICRDQNYNTITMPLNVGLTAGFKVGMSYARLHHYDAALQFDADGQHNPIYIKNMIEEMETNNQDIVIGSRYIDSNQNTHSLRLIGSNLITALIKLTTRQYLSDPTSGMRLYNKDMIKLFSERDDFGPEPDSVAYLIRKGAKVSEVPVKMRDRAAGKSYLNPRNAIAYMLRTCTSILLLQWFR